MRARAGRARGRFSLPDRVEVRADACRTRWATAALVRCALPRDKMAMDAGIVRTCARWVLDFALPPRCAGCGTIVAEVHSFCADCWKQVEFLGHAGCATCGLPLQATDSTDLRRLPRQASADRPDARCGGL